MNSGMRIVWFAVASCALSACHFGSPTKFGECRESNAYLSAGSLPALKVPTGMDAPDTTNLLKLPVLSGPAPPPRPSSAPCLDTPPSYKVATPKPAPQA
jgi:uncharacterized lipoprotein